MNKHTLTLAQLEKFFKAVGTTSIPNILSGIGTYTTNQLRTMSALAGGLQSFPKITDDPRVNFAIDCVVALEQEDDEEPGYDERMYAAEVESFRIDGLLPN